MCRFTLRKKEIIVLNILLDYCHKTIKCRTQAVPACREASEPLFEERSDAVKVGETLCLG
ncbi:MAG: hypothetical protein E6293_08490 [Dialister sp.]|nr:hypothetical protein [Dialister sp.]